MLFPAMTTGGFGLRLTLADSDISLPEPAAVTPPSPNLVRTLLSLAIDWLRWTQLVPMVLAWAALLGGLAVFAFVNFQSQGLDVIEALQGWWARHEWLPRVALPEGRSGDDGSWQVVGEDFRRPVLAVWGWLSVGLWLLGMAWQFVSGPRPPWPLRRKFKVALLAAAVAWALFVAIYLVSSQVFHGSLLQWLLTFCVLCLLPVLVSCYALTVAHVLERLSGLVAGQSQQAG
jgi:hypothetical protein